MKFPEETSATNDSNVSCLHKLFVNESRLVTLWELPCNPPRNVSKEPLGKPSLAHVAGNKQEHNDVSSNGLYIEGRKELDD